MTQDLNWKVGDLAERLEDHALVRKGEVHPVTQIYSGGYLGFGGRIVGEWNPRGWRKVEPDRASPRRGGRLMSQAPEGGWTAHTDAPADDLAERHYALVPMRPTEAIYRALSDYRHNASDDAAWEALVVAAMKSIPQPSPEEDWKTCPNCLDVWNAK